MHDNYEMYKHDEVYAVEEIDDDPPQGGGGVLPVRPPGLHLALSTEGGGTGGILGPGVLREIAMRALISSCVSPALAVLSWGGEKKATGRRKRNKS